MQEFIDNKNKPLIVVLGGGIQQTRCIRRCQELGFLSCCFDINKNCSGDSTADLFFQISIKNHTEIISIVTSLENVVAVLAPATDSGNVTACRVANKFNLLYNSEEVGITTYYKSLMREKISSLGLANPKYFTIDHETNTVLPLYSSESAFDFPCIIKPIDSSAGRGITICNSPTDIKKGVSYALNESQEGVAIVEKIIKGPQFSLETLSFNGRHTIVAIVAQTMDSKEKHVEVGHILPAPASQKIYKMLSEYAIKLLNGFEIKFGACHIEVRIVGEEIYILDFASRMGGWRDVMVESILGDVYIDAFIKSHLPEGIVTKEIIPLDYAFSKSQFCVARMVFNLDDLNLLEDLVDKGECTFECVDRELLRRKNDSMKNSLADSAGHFLYISNLSKENSIVAKYNCVDLIKDFFNLI